jgi:hypothetical protein
LFENFPIRLPEEQDLGPFHWIVTGIAGIGSWVAKKHLGRLVFDWPLFTAEERSAFAKNLCNSLRINLETGIDGFPPAGVNDWLEERFGGVVGYIAELFLEIISPVWMEESKQSFLTQQKEDTFLTSNLPRIGSMKSSLLQTVENCYVMLGCVEALPLVGSSSH